MKILLAPAFIVCCLLFVIHQLLQKILHIRIQLADDYLDNLLVTPILLTFLVVEKRILFRRGPDYVLSKMEIVMATILIAIVSELLFPYLSKDFVTDWVDIVFYISGSLIFYFAINFYPRSYQEKKQT